MTLVAVVMGSPSDWETMEHASRPEELGPQARVLRRIARRKLSCVRRRRGRGAQVIIASGRAAHLAGVVASKTLLRYQCRWGHSWVASTRSSRRCRCGIQLRRDRSRQGGQRRSPPRRSSRLRTRRSRRDCSAPQGAGAGRRDVGDPGLAARRLMAPLRPERGVPERRASPSQTLDRGQLTVRLAARPRARAASNRGTPPWNAVLLRTLAPPLAETGYEVVVSVADDTAPSLGSGAVGSRTARKPSESSSRWAPGSSRARIQRRTSASDAAARIP
jgi:hypothetical protein